MIFFKKNTFFAKNGLKTKTAAFFCAAKIIFFTACPPFPFFWSCKAEVHSAQAQEAVFLEENESGVLCEVVFDTNGGAWKDEEDGKRYVKADDFVKPPASPSLEGCAFAGWYEDRFEPFAWNEREPAAGRFSANKKIKASAKFYALWKITPPDAYSVTFMQTQEGEIVYTGFVYLKDSYKWVGATPSAGSREHYTSDGLWWTEAAGGEVFSSGTSISGDITVYAHWTAEKYSIYYWLNDETNGIYSTSVVEHPVSRINFPLVPKRSGYAFYGWYTQKHPDLRHNLEYDDDAPEENIFTPYTAVLKDIHVYALWKEIPPGSYTVKFIFYGDDEGGSNYAVERSAVFENRYKLNAQDFPPMENRPHYTCDGEWYMENGGKFTSETELASDISVAPKWTGNLYTVKFMRSGAVESVWLEMTARYPEPLGNIPAGYPYISEHYTPSENWYTAKSGGEKLTAESKITEDVKAYLHWKGASYKVRFFAYAGGENVFTAERTVVYPTDSFTPPQAPLLTAADTPVLTHYFFNGEWKTAAEGGGAAWPPGEPVVRDMDLYGVYTPKTYTVEFNSLGGKPSGFSKSATYPASSFNLPENPSKTGYLFTGWKKTGDSRWFTGAGVDSNFTVNAVWAASSLSQEILQEFDEAMSEAGARMTAGGAYDDHFLVGSGVYTGPPDGKDLAEALMNRLSLAAALRRGVEKRAEANTESGLETIYWTEYDYAAMNAVKQEIEDIINDPSYRPGTFASTEQTLHYSGALQSVTVMNGGLYEIELWGASGGNVWSSNQKTALGGKGAYTKGGIRLNAGDVLKFYVGGSGFGTASYDTSGAFFSKIKNYPNSGAAAYEKGHNGGWNGGGRGGDAYVSASGYAGGGGGGGATDVRFAGTYEAGVTNKEAFSPPLSSRIMVAGGGGGAAQSAGIDNNTSWPGLAGGDAGKPGVRKGGLTSGGARAGGQSAQAPLQLPQGSATSGSYAGTGGQGASGSSSAYEGTGGGGGGYYGGESINVLGAVDYTSSGAGGSSYIDDSRFTSERKIDINPAFGDGKASIRFIE
ncbi:MAG: InlB B-repeat-containing protein [Spirochaetaceae bacterium]|jgi:hypothetical protein|nr:InlB B-repeat-containing protein [Spirochaetaceae bacterium]